MSEFVGVFKSEEVSPGVLKTAVVHGRKIAVTNISGNYYAFADECTHARCSLSEGFLQGLSIECPCHGARFDITSGAVEALPATEPIKVYPVKVEGGRVFVDVGQL